MRRGELGDHLAHSESGDALGAAVGEASIVGGNDVHDLGEGSGNQSLGGGVREIGSGLGVEDWIRVYRGDG